MNSMSSLVGSRDPRDFRGCPLARASPRRPEPDRDVAPGEVFALDACRPDRRGAENRSTSATGPPFAAAAAVPVAAAAVPGRRGCLGRLGRGALDGGSLGGIGGRAARARAGSCCEHERGDHADGSNGGSGHPFDGTGEPLRRDDAAPDARVRSVRRLQPFLQGLDVEVRRRPLRVEAFERLHQQLARSPSCGTTCGRRAPRTTGPRRSSTRGSRPRRRPGTPASARAPRGRPR